jgi:hypothetical protein
MIKRGIFLTVNHAHEDIAQTTGNRRPKVLEKCDLLFELSGLPQVIRILKRDNLATRGFYSPIARDGSASIGLRDDTNPIAELTQPRLRIVGRTVINHDQLEIRVRLLKHIGDRLTYQFAPVVSWDYDTDQWTSTHR